MTSLRETENLMVRIMTVLADAFGNHAVLKGGMELRLLDCPIFTNDLDYIFVPFSSKNDIEDGVLNELKKNPDFSVSCSVNSKCIRYIVTCNSATVQVEVNVAQECKTSELSTSSLAQRNNMQSRIIRVMDLPSALSHKLAAWNERGLIRDLYDVYYLKVILHVDLDFTILKSRLLKIEPRSRGGKPGKMSIGQFVQKLKDTSFINQSDVEKELRDYLEPQQLPGLEKKIISALNRVIEFIESHSNSSVDSH